MQLLVHIPDALVKRLHRAVPVKKRSAFISDLLENALPKDEDDELYRIARAVEKDKKLHANLKIWDDASADGLETLQ